MIKHDNEPFMDDLWWENTMSEFSKALYAMGFNVEDEQVAQVAIQEFENGHLVAAITKMMETEGDTTLSLESFNMLTEHTGDAISKVANMMQLNRKRLREAVIDGEVSTLAFILMFFKVLE